MTEAKGNSRRSFPADYALPRGGRDAAVIFEWDDIAVADVPVANRTPQLPANRLLLRRASSSADHGAFGRDACAISGASRRYQPVPSAEAAPPRLAFTRGIR